MDLEERLQEAINAGVKLPCTLYSGYMSGMEIPELRIVLLPGAQTIEEDMAGNKTRVFPYEIQMRSDDEGLIQETLNRIANYLEDDNLKVTSQDGSFVLNELITTSFPHITFADEKGMLIYAYDFQVNVDTFIK